MYLVPCTLYLVPCTLYLTILIPPSDGVRDCRNKTLYEMCLLTCLRHVNSISWDCLPQHIAADVLAAAHSAGTIADQTVVRLIGSRVHTNFVTSMSPF